MDLCWQIDCIGVHERILHLLRKSEWTDCTFEFEAEAPGDRPPDDPQQTFLHAHKLILAMSSPVFAAMFYGHAADKQNSVIQITDIDLPTFSNLLEYMYTQYPYIKNENDAIKLFKAANKYILVHLEQICVATLMNILNPENVCVIYEFACFYDKKDLIEQCYEMFSSKTESVLKSCTLQNADISIIKKIVSMDTLSISSELELFNSLVNYADNFKKHEDSPNMEIQSSMAPIKQDFNQKSIEENNNELVENTVLQYSRIPEDKRAILQDVIENVRFLSMNPTELAKLNENNTVLSKDEILAIFTNKFSPNSRVPMPFGFSTKREPRIKGAGTIRHTIHNITSMVVGQKQLSAHCYIRRLPWRIVANRESDEFPSIYLELDYNATILPVVKEDWSCQAKCIISLVPVEPYEIRQIGRFTDKFCKKTPSWGLTKLIEWKQLIDPEKIYINDNSITLEVFVVADPPQGIDLELLEKNNMN